MHKWHFKAGWAAALALLVGLAPAAFAQVSTGNIYGKVTDESQAVLPGVTATLSGPFGTRVTTSDSQGEFRFLNVDHGTHKLVVTLAGFAGVSRDVVVTVGQNVNIAYGLKVAPVEETVIVTDETPVVDTRKLGTNTTISKAELAQMPSSRDPWALMRTIPGVLVDRVNVAGSESGQQSQFASKGADPKDAVWSIDGVVTTDMAAVGSSADYYSYDAFDEVNFSTGGNGVREIQTGGLGIGIVTKRGTNTFHGNASGYFTNDDLQWSNLPDELRGDPRLQGSDKADHTEKITDMTFDLGGPIVKDKLWFYGSYGDNDISIRNLNQTPDKTTLKAYSAKLNWQASGSDMISVFWFQGGKIKNGRTGLVGRARRTSRARCGTRARHWPGQPARAVQGRVEPRVRAELLPEPRRPPATTRASAWCPRAVWTRTSSSSTTSASEARGTADGAFFAAPAGHPRRSTAATSRPASAATTRSSSALGYRARRQHQRATRYPGSGRRRRFNATSTRARFYRDAAATRTEATYLSAHLGDTFTRDRLTAEPGRPLRQPDEQEGRSTIDGRTRSSRTLLPALDFAGDADTTIEWNDFSPRLGFTYALDEARKTVLRGFVRALRRPDCRGRLRLGQRRSALSFLEYDWGDRNGDEIVQLRRGRPQPHRAASPASTSPTRAASAESLEPDRPRLPREQRQRERGSASTASWLRTSRCRVGLHLAQVDRPHRRPSCCPATYWYNWIGVDQRRLPSAASGTARTATARRPSYVDAAADRVEPAASCCGTAPASAARYNGARARRS